MRAILRWVVFSIGLAGLSSMVQAQYTQNCPERRTISVPGTGKATAEANLAIVRVGYKVFGPDAKTAYATAGSTSNAITQALTGAGIPKTDIESTSQAIQHTQPFDLQQIGMNDYEERMGRQFTVTQSWTIRVKPDQAGDTLNTAINAGANESGWIQSIVEDPATLEAEASANAIANARTIAAEIAQKAGVHLGHLVSVNENQFPTAYNGPINGMQGSIFGMGTGGAIAGGMQPNNQQLVINSRRVEYTISVYTVFAIEDVTTPTK
jgi:uncharacterized protein